MPQTRDLEPLAMVTNECEVVREISEKRGVAYHMIAHESMNQETLVKEKRQVV